MTPSTTSTPCCSCSGRIGLKRLLSASPAYSSILAFHQRLNVIFLPMLMPGLMSLLLSLLSQSAPDFEEFGLVCNSLLLAHQTASGSSPVCG